MDQSGHMTDDSGVETLEPRSPSMTPATEEKQDVVPMPNMGDVSTIKISKGRCTCRSI